MIDARDETRVIPAPSPAERALEHDAAHVADEPPQLPLSRRGRRWRRWIKWGAAVLLLAVIGRDLWRRLGEASLSDVAFRWPWTVLSCIVLVGLYAAILASERALLRAFTGARLPWKQMVPIAWVPLAGKYVPGKVAAVAGAVVLLRRAGVSTAAGLSIFVLLDAIPVLSGTILAGLLLLDSAVRDRLPLASGGFAAILVIGLICIHPRVFGLLTNAALRVLRRPPLPRVPRWRDYAQPAAWSLVQWVCNAAAVWFMCLAFAPPGGGPGVADFPRLVGITALVMCASYFSAFVTPGGLGVREGLFLPLLATLLPLPAAAAVTLAMRVAHTLVELVLCGIGLWMLRHLEADSSAVDLDSSGH